MPRHSPWSPTPKASEKAQHRAVSESERDKLAEFSALAAHAAEDSVGAVDTFFRTGLVQLDMALGGGFIDGVTELCGPESVGKTAILGQAIAAAQAQGMDTALISSEYLDVYYLKNLGVDLNRLFMMRARGTPGLTYDLVHQFAVGFCSIPNNVLGIDSLTAVRNADQTDDGWSEMIFDLLTSLKERLTSSRSYVLATSQVRTKFVAGRPTAGTRSTLRRFEDLFDCRVHVDRMNVSDETYTMMATVESALLAGPGRYVEMPAKKGSGVLRGESLVIAAEVANVLERRGSYFYLDGGLIGQGVAEAGRVLGERRDLFDKVYRLVVRS